jgi:Uma2 family endonuclease
MEEYIANGASLGWLIDPLTRRVHIYRPGEEPFVLENPEVVSGDPLLPGFKLEMVEIW